MNENNLHSDVSLFTHKGCIQPRSGAGLRAFSKVMSCTHSTTTPDFKHSTVHACSLHSVYKTCNSPSQSHVCAQYTMNCYMFEHMSHPDISVKTKKLEETSSPQVAANSKLLLPSESPSVHKLAWELSAPTSCCCWA